MRTTPAYAIPASNRPALRTPLARLLAAAAVAGPVVAGVPTAVAQNAAAERALAERSELETLQDFVHFVLIARHDIANALGQQLLSSGMTAEQFTQMVDDSGELARFTDAVARVARRDGVGELGDTAADLAALYQRGKLDRARNAEEIEKNIELLTGNLRGKRLARERLIEAGEYAVPQLLEALLQIEQPLLRAEARGVLVDMGRQAVAPLSEALPDLGAAQQEQVIETLGLIPYRASAPAIALVKAQSSVPAVDSAADRALERLGVGSGASDPANLYATLAEGYYAEREDLTSFPGEDFQLVWDYDAGAGLVPLPVRTEVFHEAMAMRSAERALSIGSADPSVIALWVAANHSREIDSAEGYENPTYPSDRRDAEYFGIAAGVRPLQMVLARATSDRDTPLARRAIAGLAQIAGGRQLWSGLGDARPLTEALRYPNRRVQIEAALALGSAQPTESFAGSERVVPILAAGVQNADARHAIVIARDAERYQALRQILENQGYSVLPQGRTAGDVEAAIAELAAVDLAVVAMPTDQARGMIGQIRNVPKLAATPILGIVDALGYERSWRAYENDQTITLRKEGVSAAQLGRSIDSLVEAASGGPISDAEARLYAERSIATLRDLAISESTVLAAVDGTLPLIGALNRYDGSLRIRVAEVLALIDDARAQVAIADAALTSSGRDRVALLRHLATSAKRSGNQLAPAQVDRLLDVARTGDDAEATAAAAAVGAMGLSNQRLLPLLTGD